MYTMNNMPYDGLKTLQSLMKNIKANSYYGPMDDEGYGYMPMSGSDALGHFNFFGLGDGFDSMHGFNKKPVYEAIYPGAGYVRDVPKKDIDCEKKEEQDWKSKEYSAEPRFSEYYKTKKDHNHPPDDLGSYYGKNGPPTDIMTIISNLNKMDNRKRRRDMTTTTTPAEEDTDDQSSEEPPDGQMVSSKTKHMSKAKQIAQMLEMLDKMNK